MDALLPHKEALQEFLRDGMGRLFDVKFDFLLYDITSTYFEGEAHKNDLARRGYSRDGRPDCKQVCLGLVVAEGGMPIGYELFPGNTSHGATLQGIVEHMEERYGLAQRVWVLDRGMISEENLEFLRRGDRRSYIVGTPRSALKSFESELLKGGWEEVRSGVELKLCPGPHGEETFILCRSRGRRQKEKAIHERFEKKIEKRLRKIQSYCEKRNYRPEVIGERIGRLKQKYSRAAGLFDIEIVEKPGGGVRLLWQNNETRREFSELSEGCYLLRSNIRHWSASELWEAYVQLTEAEAAFRIQKTDLRIRPIWHQKETRVRAHILVCFLAYVLWKTLAGLCERSGLGNEPRRVFDELSRIKLVDVVLPTRSGVETRKRCVTRPDEGQQILLEHLGMTLPESIDLEEM
jgi:transposase